MGLVQGHPVRRFRRLQGDRGRGLHARDASRRRARGVRRRRERGDRRRAGARRIPLHRADARVHVRREGRQDRFRHDGAYALDAHLAQPRALQRGASLRGRGRLLGGDGQADAPRRRDEVRGPRRPHVRPRADAAEGRARARGDRARALQALPRHRREALPRPREVLPRGPRTRRRGGRREGLRAERRARRGQRDGGEEQLLAEPHPRGAAARGRGARGARDVPLLRHGGRRRAHGQRGLRDGDRRPLGERRRQEARPERIRRRASPRRDVRRELGASERGRVQRDVRLDRQRALERAHVPHARRGEVRRRAGARRLQRNPQRREPRRRRVLLSEPARVEGRLQALEVVRVQLLSRQRRAVHTADRPLRLRDARRRGVRKPVRGQRRAARARRRRGEALAAHGVSVERRGEAHRRRHKASNIKLQTQRPHPRLVRGASGPERPLHAGLARLARGLLGEGERRAVRGEAAEGLLRDRPRVEGRRHG